MGTVTFYLVHISAVIGMTALIAIAIYALTHPPELPRNRRRGNQDAA